MNSTPCSISKVVICGLRITFCLGLIIFAILGAFFYLPATVKFHVIETYFFSGESDDVPIYLGIILPKSGPYQWVGNQEISWEGLHKEENHGSVDVIKFSGVKKGGKNLIARVEYDVKLPQGPASWSAPVENFQRLPQDGIESDCECIQSIAADLSEGTSEKDAYDIYAFTADYLTYSEEYKDCTSLSAMQAYEIGFCVCAGYARLMTALCRAAEIPAQMVLGLVYPDLMFRSGITSFPENPDEAHAWVEYYAEGSWKMADPTWGAKHPKFMQFNRNDGRHLAYGELEQVLSVDQGIEGWAFDQARIVLGNDECFRYVATSDSAQVSFFTKTSIQTKWDGRWVNTIIAWGITTFLLCKYRGKIIGDPHQKNESRHKAERSEV